MSNSNLARMAEAVPYGYGMRTRGERHTSAVVIIVTRMASCCLKILVQNSGWQQQIQSFSFCGYMQELAEAMCLNVPILVNREIAGGWKYVVDETGEAFGTSDEFVEALRRLQDPVRKARLKPREWYM